MSPRVLPSAIMGIPIKTHGQIVDLIYTAIREPMERSPYFCTTEGSVKMFICDYLLSKGYTILEGGQSGAKGIYLSNGKIVTYPTSVKKPDVQSSVDIRVHNPIQCIIELQCRSHIGTTNSLFSKNIVDDVWRVEKGKADLFVLVCDDHTFSKMQGLRDTRGRKPLYADFLPNLLNMGEVRTVQTVFGYKRHVFFYTKTGLLLPDRQGAYNE